MGSTSPTSPANSPATTPWSAAITTASCSAIQADIPSALAYPPPLNPAPAGRR